MSAIPSLLTAQQRALLAPLRRRSPVPVERLAEVLYSGRPDGGPEHAPHVIRIQIQRIRERLAPFGIRILTLSGQGYMVDPAHVPALNQLLDGGSLEFELERARA